jgi:hypothetical protein
VTIVFAHLTTNLHSFLFCITESRESLGNEGMAFVEGFVENLLSRLVFTVRNASLHICHFHPVSSVDDEKNEGTFNVALHTFGIELYVDSQSCFEFADLSEEGHDVELVLRLSSFVFGSDPDSAALNQGRFSLLPVFIVSITVNIATRFPFSVSNTTSPF